MKPKILVVDIETMAAVGYFWRMFKENISLDQMIAPPRVISWAAKWIGEPKIYQGDEYQDDIRNGFLERLYRLLEQADAVVTYNGDRFDLPKLNGEFARIGFDPLPPIASIDLVRTVKKLGLISNKLEHVVTYFELGHKLKHEGFPLWKEWNNGNVISIAKMRKYNIHDVRLTDKLYRAIRPYIKNHPYLGPVPLNGKQVCPNCNSTHLHHRGHRRTRLFVVERLQCQGCGAWSDGVKRRIK